MKIDDNMKSEELISTETECLQIVISKEEVSLKDYSVPLKILNQVTSDISSMKYYRERIDISFKGYNDKSAEIWEIPEVRNYVEELDSRFPYWLYFLSKDGMGLSVILKCFLLPFLKHENEKELNGGRLQFYLEERGFLAMNQLCDLTNISAEEHIQMTHRLVNYIQQHLSFMRGI